MSMTRILCLVTGSNLENRWPQRDIRFPSQMWKPAEVVQAVTKTKKNRKKNKGEVQYMIPSRAKVTCPVMGQKSRVAGEIK